LRGEGGCDGAWHEGRALTTSSPRWCALTRELRCQAPGYVCARTKRCAHRGYGAACRHERLSQGRGAEGFFAIRIARGDREDVSGRRSQIWLVLSPRRCPASRSTRPSSLTIRRLHYVRRRNRPAPAFSNSLDFYYLSIFYCCRADGLAQAPACTLVFIHTNGFIFHTAAPSSHFTLRGSYSFYVRRKIFYSQRLRVSMSRDRAD